MLAEDVKKEQQKDIILNVQRSDDVARRFKGGDHRIDFYNCKRKLLSIEEFIGESKAT